MQQENDKEAVTRGMLVVSTVFGIGVALIVDHYASIDLAAGVGILSGMVVAGLLATLVISEDRQKKKDDHGDRVL